MNNISIKNNLFICECSSMEHQFIVSFDSDKDWNEYIYVHVHLNNNSLFKRLIKSIKYIFGYKCKYGCFEEVLLDKVQTKRLIDVLSKHYQLME
jgi:hypothetical protein